MRKFISLLAVAMLGISQFAMASDYEPSKPLPPAPAEQKGGTTDCPSTVGAQKTENPNVAMASECPVDPGSVPADDASPQDPSKAQQLDPKSGGRDVDVSP